MLKPPTVEELLHTRAISFVAENRGTAESMGENILDASAREGYDQSWGNFSNRTVSILELVRFHLSAFLHLGIIHGMAHSTDPTKFIGGGWRIQKSEFINIMENAKKDVAVADMPLAVTQAERVLEYIQSPTSTPQEAFNMIRDFTSRVTDYLEGRTALIIPFAEKHYYDEPLLGWEVSIESFPGIHDSVEESSKCLALGRDTACVYHLSGVVQVVLEALATRLRVSLNPYSDTWNKLIADIEAAMRALQTTMPRNKWKAVEPFYSEVVSDIRSMKNAWRNQSMHFRRTYSHEQAEKVYRHVCDFTTHAATKLKSRKVV